MQTQIDAAFLDHLVRDPFPAVRIEGGGEYDGLGLRLRAEIVETPARPFTEHRLAGDPVLLGRVHAQADTLHALDHLHAQSGDGDLRTVVHVVEDEHHAAGGETAQIRIALQQGDARTHAPGRDGRREAGRPAADHDDVGAGDDRHAAGGFGDAIHMRPLARCQVAAGACQRMTNRSAAEMARKKQKAKPEPTSTVA